MGLAPAAILRREKGDSSPWGHALGRETPPEARNLLRARSRLVFFRQTAPHEQEIRRPLEDPAPARPRRTARVGSRRTPRADPLRLAQRPEVDRPRHHRPGGEYRY